MKKLFVIIFVLLACGSFAQQGLQMELPPQDSAEMEFQRKMEYFQLISGNAAGLSGLESSPLLPEVNFNQPLIPNGYISTAFQFNPDIQNFSLNHFDPLISSPFYTGGKVFSAAAYNMGNKITVGGFSYGANSVFSSPLPNKGLNQFDSYGSSMFFQYKVSKKVKIETRINVQQGGHPGVF